MSSSLARRARNRLRSALLRAATGGLADGRALLALKYLKGDGIEVGALTAKLPVPRGTRVRYVDRLTVKELRGQYPELDGLPLVEPDVVDDGETLDSFAAESLDFVAASHFIEHCENPIGTIRHQLLKLRRGGVLFLVVPDKRATFDARREVTSVEHLVRDDRDGPEWSRRQHYVEWVRDAQAVPEDAVESTVERLLDQSYSIHFHVWTPEAFLELVTHCRDVEGLEFEFVAFERTADEFVVVLAKQSAI
jgi:SAM-dependent methyltransferase